MPIIMTNIEKRDAERTSIVNSFLIKWTDTKAWSEIYG